MERLMSDAPPSVPNSKLVAFAHALICALSTQPRAGVVFGPDLGASITEMLSLETATAAQLGLDAPSALRGLRRPTAAQSSDPELMSAVAELKALLAPLRERHSQARATRDALERTLYEHLNTSPAAWRDAQRRAEEHYATDKWMTARLKGIRARLELQAQAREAQAT